VYEAAARAAAAVHGDPRTACFYARRALELAVSWAYKHDAALKLPYQDNVSALIHEPSFKQAAGEAVFSKARVINSLGNQAVHSHSVVPESDALAAVRELFHFTYWFARTYARAGQPAPGLAFDATVLPRPKAVAQQRAEQLRALEQGLRERDEKLASLLADKGALDEELSRLRAEVAQAKKAAAAQITPIAQGGPGEPPDTQLASRSVPEELRIGARQPIVVQRLHYRCAGRRCGPDRRRAQPCERVVNMHDVRAELARHAFQVRPHARVPDTAKGDPDARHAVRPQFLIRPSIELHHMAAFG
jgi:hypothetical protein